MIDTKVFEMYSYSDKERGTFPYIDRYMELVKINPNRFTDAGFALAGLFLTFRACNHSGCAMTTNVDEIRFQANSLHYKRLAAIKELVGIEFGDSRGYLRIARIGTLSLLLPCRHQLLLRIANMRIQV